MTTWFITGCSTGLGRALAHAVLSRGDNAIVTARSVGTLDDLVQQHPDTALAIELDVTDPEQISAAVSRGTERFSGIDVLVNNAGYGYRSAVEEGDHDDIERLFATNFHGPVALIKAVLPGMRAQRSGVVVNISSIAASVQPAGSGYYAASKAALEGVSGALTKEVASLGIRVITVEPGGFRTDFAGRSLTQSPAAIDDYAETAGKRRKENDTVHGTQPGDPARAAEALITVVDAEQPPAFLLLGSDALTAVRSVIAARSQQIDQWEQLSAGTDFGAAESTGTDQS